MELRKNTVLITGGSSGIGLELARSLIEKDNTVILCGRSMERLERAKLSLPTVKIIQCNVSKFHEIQKMATWIQEHHPQCNMLINNAAIAHKAQFYEDASILEKARAEIDTNLMAPITLCKLLIPILEKNERAKIVNITTGLVYAPRAIYPFYNATKAALHSFTQVLRMQLKDIPIEVIEVLFPVVDSPWHQGNVPPTAISTKKAVEGMVNGLEKGVKEIQVGKVKLLFWLSRIAPKLAVQKINSFND